MSNAQSYAAMGAEEYPFALDGMSVEEIEAFYKEAANKNEGVRILADCCGTDANSMLAFLTARGLVSGVGRETARQAATRKKVEQYLALAERGKNLQEAAEELGASTETVKRFCERHGVQFNGMPPRRPRKPSKKTEKKTEAKPAAAEVTAMQELVGWIANTALELKESGAEVLKVQAAGKEAAVGYRDPGGSVWVLKLSCVEEK